MLNGRTVGISICAVAVAVGAGMTSLASAAPSHHASPAPKPTVVSLAYKALEEVSAAPAWKSILSWCLASNDDRRIPAVAP